MRPRATLAKLLATVAAAAFPLVSKTGAATAQVIVSPNAEPTRNDGGWIYWLAIALTVVGILAALLITFAYMRYAPRFQRDEDGRKTVKAARIQPGKEAPRRPVNITGAPVVVPAPAVVSAAPAPAAGAAPAAVAAAPVPMAAPAVAEPAVAPPAPAPPATAAAPSTGAAAAETPAAGAAPAGAPAPAAAEREEVSIDQETFDRVLAELLEKGTTRRVAEGQARRAAMIAARKKAGG